MFGLGQGNPGTITHNPGTITTPPSTTFDFNQAPTGTTLAAAGRLFGLDILSTLDLSENDGLVTILAEPNLTALSGETASFLAGGEFPVPISQALGSVTIEYKQYGVGLAFTPIVLADGRISMRVRPEVSELSTEGSIRLNGFDVPALTTRRAETTVELGSGQSFMIAGLLRNANTNDVSKAPFLGDLPILGALFRSTKYRRAETELVIVVTPYLVRPVSNQAALPTDGYRAPTEGQLVLEGQSFTGVSGPRPASPAPAPAITGSSAVTAAPASPGFKL
jgi:pilus assembly protein CpaC